MKIDEKNKDGERAVKMAKLIASQTASKIIDNGLQFHGGAGFTRDIPFERWYKELRIARLLYGETETLLEEIAEKFFSN
jgi:alkylation response protein AidB-like acyl-CoA dehydrogenase